jgi:hypothetical protein
MTDTNNEYEIKIRGACDISQPLQIDKEYYLAFPVQCRSIEKGKTNMGADIYTHKCEISGSGVIQNPDGKKIPTKDKRSMSKQLRSAIWSLWDKGTKEIDEETFYETTMRHIIKNIDNIGA